MNENQLSPLIKATYPEYIDHPKYHLGDLMISIIEPITVIVGPVKSGKTTAASWIAGRAIKQGLKILWLDTDQGEYHALRSLHWALESCGKDEYIDINVFDLSGISQQSELNATAEKLIKQHRPDIIVIDDVRGWVSDPSDSNEGYAQSKRFVGLTRAFDCHVITTIQDTNKVLLAALSSQAGTVMSVKSDNKQRVKCTPLATRSEPFTPFKLKHSGNGEISGVPVLVQKENNE